MSRFAGDGGKGCGFLKRGTLSTKTRMVPGKPGQVARLTSCSNLMCFSD